MESGKWKMRGGKTSVIFYFPLNFYSFDSFDF